MNRFFADIFLLILALARTLFYPTLDLNARYSRANGGRTIDVPVGTLLNGAYSTLNQLTNTRKFPQISDVSTPYAALLEPAPLPTLTATASQDREELQQLRRGVAIADLGVAQARTRYQPTINGVVDFGYQGVDYNFSTPGSRFPHASAVLNWNLFGSLQNKHRVATASLAQRQQQTQLRETSARVELEAEVRQPVDGKDPAASNC